MVDTILFDLDGTLILFSQKAFIGAYFTELTKVFAKIGMDPELSVKAVWAGTKAMMQNDGSKLNKHRFWATFADTMQISGDNTGVVEAACDSFYENEFDAVKAVTTPTLVSQRLVRTMVEKGYNVALATNPLFPECAVSTRLRWIGLEINDFQLVTHYANSTYCKPNPRYFREVFAKIGKKPEQCLMIGNNPAEDMAAGKLGTETFLVTDFLENDAGLDITAFRRGTLAELEACLIGMPEIMRI